MLPTEVLDYPLPESAIATRPAEPRDSARLMVVDRAGRLIEHARVRDLPRFLRADDLLVLNTTKVIPARLEGVRSDTGGRASGLYLGPSDGPSDGSGARRWTVYIRTRRARPGVEIGLWPAGYEPPTPSDADALDADSPEHEGAPDARHHGTSPRHAPARSVPLVDPPPTIALRLRLLERSADEPGAWIAEVLPGEGAHAAVTISARDDESLLGLVGRTPLPPYIIHARKVHHERIDDAHDRARYQTVYAADDSDHRGASVAAPTAGLHLTPELLSTLHAGGVGRADVVLHVGSGTFKPVAASVVEQHDIHAEWCSMTNPTRRAILQRRTGVSPRGRVICVGTTSARTVESYAGLHDANDPARDLPPWLSTKLLVTPGYRWRWTDGLLTNFHLPRSTLLAMVGSLMGHDAHGVERLKALYAAAIEHGYRFFSYGDAMLILPE